MKLLPMKLYPMPGFAQGAPLAAAKEEPARR